MGSDSLRDRISPYRGGLTVLLLAFLLAAVWLTEASPLIYVYFAVPILFLGASTFDSFRDHPVYNLLRGTFVLYLVGGQYLLTPKSRALLILTILSAFGVAVEAYNYVKGTSYLRVEFPENSG
ncbi:hypothetical protein ACEU6E_07365 [Halorutilales archaeon Cl-col2-1]